MVTKDLLRKRDPSGGWRLFVSVFMFVTFVMLGFASYTISKAYQLGQDNVRILCEAVDIALDADDQRPIECKEFLQP